MSVYSVQLFAGFIPVAATVVYTVPVGATVIVRDIELFNATSAPTDMTVSVGVSGSPLAVIARVLLVPVLAHVQWTGRAVLNPGQDIQVSGGGTGSTVLISGYNLV